MRANGSSRVRSDRAARQPGASPGNPGSPRQAGQSRLPPREEREREARRGQKGWREPAGVGGRSGKMSTQGLRSGSGGGRERGCGGARPAGPASAPFQDAPHPERAWAAPSGVYKCRPGGPRVTELRACERAGEQPRLPFRSGPTLPGPAAYTAPRLLASTSAFGLRPPSARPPAPPPTREVFGKDHG